MLSTLMYFIVTLLLLIVVHEYGHFIVARCCRVKVIRFSFGFGKVLWSWRDKRGTEYVWSLLPIGGYVKLLDDSNGPVAPTEQVNAFHHQPLIIRLLIVLAGPLFNFLFAFFALWLAAVIGIKSFAPIVDSVVAESPAQRAGLVQGDEIVAIDHHPVTDWFGLVHYLKNNAGAKVYIDVQRQGHLQQMMVRLLFNAKESTHYLGINARVPKEASDWSRIYRLGPIDAARQASHQTIRLISMSLSLIGQLITGHSSLDHLSGPVGIAKAASASAHSGLVTYLSFLALISISVGVLNLLPIPMLDGGYVLYYLIEAIIRRPLSIEFKTKGVWVGMICMMFLAMIALSNDFR